jgi:hypothetical protein
MKGGIKNGLMPTASAGKGPCATGTERLRSRGVWTRKANPMRQAQR